MKKIIFLAFAIMLITSVSANAQEGDSPFDKNETGLFPVLKEGYKPQFSIAPQISYINFNDINSSGIAFGGEIALQCPLLGTKKNYIRQQLSFTYFDDPDSEFSAYEITINPEYRFMTTSNFELAAGPSLGFLHAEVDNTDFSENVFSYGLSASATLHFGEKMFSGVSFRQNWASDDLSHYQGMLKLGYKL